LTVAYLAIRLLKYSTREQLMEISRQSTPGYNLQPDSAQAGTVQGDAAIQAKAEVPGLKTASSGEPRLEQLQEAMRSLPDVDLDKIAAIRLALQRGDISSDSAMLAGSILAYHRGSSDA
jgi:negative regulator of flagellin synthesis FlgM